MSKDTGAVTCWGINLWGNLGIGDASQIVPTTSVQLPGPAKDVQATGIHACALVDGDVYCWGSNDFGELGIGSTTSQSVPTTAVALGKNATQLAVGGQYTCVILRNGQVKCWGSNDGGQLGNGSTQNASLPGAPLALDAKAVDISAGQSHACAVLETGQIECWGSNFDGQLGIGEIGFFPKPPKQVVGLAAPAVSVTCGDVHTCATLADGRVQCWGNNGLYELGLGDGDPFGHPTPALVDIGFPVADVDAGFFYTCALSTTGDVKCWGFDGNDTIPSQIPNLQF